MKTLERIVLIDDDPDTNFYNKIILKKTNTIKEIIVFENGKDALQYLEEGNKNIDLILLDINMPIMNGWQFLNKYENIINKKLNPIVVVMLTSSANSDDKRKANMFKSVRKFINKPLTHKTVREILALFENQVSDNQSKNP